VRLTPQYLPIQLNSRYAVIHQSESMKCLVRLGTTCLALFGLSYHDVHTELPVQLPSLP
jgi:hypothetical protein